MSWTFFFSKTMAEKCTIMELHKSCMKTNVKLPIYLYMDACVISITVHTDLNFTWSYYSINLWVFSSIKYILLYQCPFYHSLTWSSFINLFVCSNFLEELEYRIKSCPAPDLNCLHGCIHLVATIAKCKKKGVKFRFQGQKTWMSTLLISVTLSCYIYLLL